MRWDFGAVYKEIRQAKGLTQSQVCGNHISRTTLSKIESCQSIPNVENMIFLLRQIDMTLEEFEYICNLYHPSQRATLMNKIQQIISLPKSENIQQLYQECQHYLKKHEDRAIYRLCQQLEVSNAVTSSKNPTKDETSKLLAKEIWDYLEKADTWYISELRMISAILYYFPMEYLETMTDRILENHQKYANYRNVRQYQLPILTNLSTIYLYNHRKERCWEISQMILEIAKKEKRYDSLGICQVRIGICSNNQELMNKGLQLLDLTEENELKKLALKEIKNYF